MDFDEALGRFAQVKPGELTTTTDGPVRVREDDTGARFVLYVSDKGIRHELRYEGEQPWFTQKQLADMFAVDVSVVNRHIANFIGDGDLDPSTFAEFAIVQSEGPRQVSRPVKHYGLDVAFYVGYRVNSAAGILFRRWATAILIRFATKGFVIDKERLKAPDQPSVLDELKDTIREIRASTQNVYREVKRICTMCQDYDRSDRQAAGRFWSMMENKLLWASTGMTGGEIIMERADINKPDMGLTYYTGKRGPTQDDVQTANNYLAQGEAERKNRATTMLLDYFEEQLDQGRLVTMAEAEAKLNEFIKFNKWPLLTHKGRVKGDDARDHAVALHRQYKLLN